MAALILRRVGQAVPVLICATIFAFLLLNALPGNVAIAILGTNATPSSIATVNRQLNLDQPLPVRYWNWLWAALHGNLGNSFIDHSSVLTTVAARVPVSLELVVGALCVALLLAIPTALLSVKRHGGIADRIAMVITILGLSLPNFVVALVLILVFAVRLHLFPAIGWVPLTESIGGNLRSLTLPVLAISFVFFGTYARLLRADMLQQLETEEYVVLARAKGRGEWWILLRHVLRNSAFSLIVVVGTNFGTLVGTTAIVETIFSLPGVGQLLVTSIYNRDAPMVQGVVLVLGIVVILVNLATDLLHTTLDPRVRYGRS